jgi:hypothetical protein
LCLGVYRATRVIGVEMTIYQENGYENRKDYLIDLADSYGLDQSIVFALADMLGSTEDFDGLVNTLEDIQYQGGY